jgi:hypothetical protein
MLQILNTNKRMYNPQSFSGAMFRIIDMETTSNKENVSANGKL